MTGNTLSSLPATVKWADQRMPLRWFDQGEWDRELGK